MSSYYEALPIYKVAMDVVIRVDAVVQRFAKGLKHTLGSRLREITLDLVMLIARSNRRAERARQIPLLCDLIQDLKLMLKLGKACGNVKRRRLTYVFERSQDTETKPEVPE
ncbi:MAG: hypothetical protein JXP73_14245 [Deltaproteobacteria bacterium]|nr:hypothetical protein [Deltaproteobacteria bacterium]